MITSTLSLKNSILKSNPDADTSVLEDLCTLVRKHQLKWVTRGSLNSAYFVMSQLSVAKGLDKEDYINYWSPNQRPLVKHGSLESLPGQALKLEGEKLASFKKLYKESWDESLGKINSLWVGDWVHAYAYLTQGTTEAAKGFQKLGAKAIETSSTQEINKLHQPENNVIKFITEAQLQDQIIKLAAYSTVNFRFEVGVKNSFPTHDQASHRRWDWVERLPKVTKVYELKARTVTEQDVKSTLLDKHYLELVAEKFPNKPIEFVFTSPKGISWEAKSYIQELMNNQEGYTDIFGVRAKISFIDLQAVAQRLVSNILANSPQEAWWWLLNQLRTTDLELVTSERTLNKLNAEICELYKQGVLVRKTSNNVVAFPTPSEAA